MKDRIRSFSASYSILIPKENGSASVVTAGLHVNASSPEEALGMTYDYFEKHDKTNPGIGSLATIIGPPVILEFASKPRPRIIFRNSPMKRGFP